MGLAVGATFEKYNARLAFAVERSWATSMFLVGDTCLVFIPEILKMVHVAVLQIPTLGRFSISSHHLAMP